MKKIMLLLFFYAIHFIYAQSIDYNTKKGYAVNGYDVVAYFDDNPQLGSKKYMTVFDGVKYKFSTQENLDKFIIDPVKYIPQYGGYCAYAVAVSGKKVSINPETYQLMDGKLYLFYNSWGTNTYESWIKESPTLLKPIADRNWEQIKDNK